MSKYKVREGTAFSQKDVSVIGPFLTKAFPKGKFTPEEIVDLAKPKSSPIHQYFEWDNTRAAHLYRIQQARKLIQCLVVIIDGDEVPGYVNVSAKVEGGDKRVYMKTEDAREVKSIWDDVITQAFQSLKSWEFRYKSLSGVSLFKPIFEVISQTEKEIKNGKKDEGRSNVRSPGERKRAGASRGDSRGEKTLLL